MCVKLITISMLKTAVKQFVVLCALLMGPCMGHTLYINVFNVAAACQLLKSTAAGTGRPYCQRGSWLHPTPVLAHTNMCSVIALEFGFVKYC